MHVRVHETQVNLSLFTFALFLVMFVLSLLALASHWFTATERPAADAFAAGWRVGFHGTAVSRALFNAVLFGVIAAVRRNRWTIIGAAILAGLGAVRLALYAATCDAGDEVFTALNQTMPRLLLFNKATWTIYGLMALVFFQMWRVRSLQIQEERKRQPALREIESEDP